MASADEFALIAKVLGELAPSNVELRSIELKRDPNGRAVVTVQTSTPGRLIGRHGTTAGAIRSAMADGFGDAALQLNIAEAPPDPPPDYAPRPGPGVSPPPS